MDQFEATILLAGGGVEYDRTEAQVSIEDLIAALQEAQQDGATHVVMGSGNYRGAQWSRLSSNWSWVEDEQ